MDFESLLYAAKKNEHTQKRESQNVKCYQTKFAPPKKEERKCLSANIQKFLARKEEEEKQRQVDANKKREVRMCTFVLPNSLYIFYTKRESSGDCAQIISLSMCANHAEVCLDRVNNCIYAPEDSQTVFKGSVWLEVKLGLVFGAWTDSTLNTRIQVHTPNEDQSKDLPGASSPRDRMAVGRELLELRSHDTKAKKRVQAMLKRTKAANKSVIEDAVDDNNTAVTLGGPSQPDEDDYGYVSQEASAYYNKLMDKYSTLPPEEPKFKSNMKHSVKDLNSTKDRVRMALLKEEEEEMLPHKRKRKPKEEKTEDGDEAEDVGEQETVEEERKPEKTVKPKRPAPPPMDFESLLKLAEKKQFEPVKIEPKVKDPEDDERPMTKKQRMEYEREKEWRMRKERAQAEKASQSRRAADEDRPQQKSVILERSQQDSAPRVSSLLQRIPKLSSRDKEQRQEDEKERRGNVRQSKDDNIEKSRNIRDCVNGKKVMNSYNREDSMTEDESGNKKREGRIEKVNRDDRGRAYREGSSGSDETRNKNREGRIEKVNRDDRGRAYREGSSGSDDTRNKKREGRIEKVNRDDRGRAYREGSSGSDETRNKKREGRIEKVNRDDRGRAYREGSFGSDETRNKKREGRIEKVNRDDRGRAYREGSSGSDETRNKKREGRIEKVNIDDRGRAYREGSFGSDETRNKKREGRIEKVNRDDRGRAYREDSSGMNRDDRGRAYREDSSGSDETRNKKREGRIEKVNRDDRGRAYREGSSGSDDTRNKKREGRIEKVNRDDRGRAYREGSSGSDESRNKKREGRIEKVNRNEGKYRNVGGNIQTEPCEIEVSGRIMKKDERRVGVQESRTEMKERKIDLKERKGGANEKREPHERREESQAQGRREIQDQIDAQEWREYQEWKEARAKERRDAQEQREAQERRETQERRDAQERREAQKRREVQVQERRDVQGKSNAQERKNEHWRCEEKSTKSKFADENSRKRPMEGSVKGRDGERGSSNAVENSRLIRTEKGVKLGMSDGREQKEERTGGSVGKQSSKDTSASSDSDKKKVSSVGSGNTMSGYSRKIQDAILAKYKERIEQSAANKIGLMPGKSLNGPVRPVVKSEGSTAGAPTMNKTDQSRAPLSKSIPKKDSLVRPQDRQQPRPMAANAGNTRLTGVQQKSASNGPSFSRQESSTSRDSSSPKLLKSPAVRDQDSNMKSRQPIQNPRDPKEGNIRQPLKADAQPRPNQSSDVRSRQFPPADVRSRQFPPADIGNRQFPPSDVRSRKFPPGDVRRKPMKPPAKRESFTYFD
ncbi:hypothetical protein PR048_018920 [Dryococelus australis]|uniref:SPT2 homolog N-terminal domain-containing protein n=1 Tax=Dryococelus australis TaxID=614101 RepID=A0ABQ9H230_9NEOP|nr:hypothetical protein PR048_018920 [Dryococelus australis]